jgi:hypothetical protein
MTGMDCPREPDVLDVVTIGQWPGRAPMELRAHVEQCETCAELALVATAIGIEKDAEPLPALPGAGAVWWRAQVRARHEAARDVVRPISVAQAFGLAAVAAVLGAVFGGTADWFQRGLHRMGTLLADLKSSWHLPAVSWPTGADLSAFSGYATIFAIAAVGIALASGVLYWAFREE